MKITLGFFVARFLKQKYSSSDSSAPPFIRPIASQREEIACGATRKQHGHHVPPWRQSMGQLEVNLLQMPPLGGSIWIGVDSINHLFAPGLSPGWSPIPNSFSRLRAPRASKPVKHCPPKLEAQTPKLQPQDFQTSEARRGDAPPWERGGCSRLLLNPVKS